VFPAADATPAGTSAIPATTNKTAAPAAPRTNPDM
jgi:hypothetical protein